MKLTKNRIAALAAASLSFTGLAATASAATSSTTPGTMTAGTMMTGEMMGAHGPLCSALPASGAGSAASMTVAPLATAASTNPLLTTLVAAVTAAGLGDTLNGTGPFTVVAPVNSAFDKIDQATLTKLLGDKDALTKILTYHVMPGLMSADDLVKAGEVATVNGAKLKFTKVNDTIVINDGAAAVQCADIHVANATVLLIDSVVMPPAA